ncbi:putative phage abortive infection protein [Acidovorax sp.]|uniref:putative phage abortive infection protein n=1 Tax=Acidovorax sp. TaxID=1872122 RepID=UPI00391A5102
MYPLNYFYSAFKRLFIDDVNDEAAVEANENLLRPLFFALLIASGAVVFILALDLIFGLTSESKLGPFGDFFGGMLNPIFTFLTFFGLIITIVIQRMELRLARVEYSKTAVALNTQAVENTFFNALDLHHEIVSGLTFDPNIFPPDSTADALRLAGVSLPRKESVSGRAVFNAVITELRNRSATHEQSFSQYEFLQKKHNYVLGHYFRNLYQALKLVDRYENLEQKEKEKYAGILRSQLSSGELALLFLNCRPRMVDSGEFRNLLVRYRMLEHLPLEFKGDFFRAAGNDLVLANAESITEYLHEMPTTGMAVQKYRGAFGTNPVQLPIDA